METNEDKTSVSPRCEKHGLALGPAGECVLCRKERLDTTGMSINSKRALVHGVWITGLVIIVAFVYKSRERRVESVTDAISVGAEVSRIDSEVKETRKRETSNNERRVNSESARVERKSEAKSEVLEKVARKPVELKSVEKEVIPVEIEKEKIEDKNVEEKVDKYALKAARRRVEIIIYVTEWCPSCRSALEYMRKEGISFKDYDIEKDERAKEEHKKLNEEKSIPVIKVDDIVLTGFGPRSLERAIDKAAKKYLQR
ncbi:MAG: glutaredoxin family protein [Deltaproteobacteria bacterium]|nr:glutaredoxin family protein [Deltaproteobacteria bacterium]